MEFKELLLGILTGLISTAIYSFYSNKLKKVYYSKNREPANGQKDFNKIKLQFYICFPISIISAFLIKSSGHLQIISYILFFFSFFFVWCSFECLKDMVEDNEYKNPEKKSNDE